MLRLQARRHSHLEDDTDVLTQGIHILEGELEGDRVGIEVGTVLYNTEGSG